MNEIVI